MIDRPLGRDLERPELRRLVAGIAARPDLWGHHVRHSRDERVYEQLHRDEHVAIWLICWMEDHDTGFHDHDLSAGAVFDFRASDIHRVLHSGDRPAVTVHAYSPPLWRMGAYEIGRQGELRRHSISYAEELRPLAEAVPAAL